MVKKLYLIGIGPGDPKYLTLEAYELIKRLKLFLVPDKREDKIGLTEIRLKIINFVKEEVLLKLYSLIFLKGKRGLIIELRLKSGGKKRPKSSLIP